MLKNAAVSHGNNDGVCLLSTTYYLASTASGCVMVGGDTSPSNELGMCTCKYNGTYSFTCEFSSSTSSTTAMSRYC